MLYHPKFFRIKTIFNLNTESLMIYDTQVYTALIISLLAGILAIRLGSTLYE
jgi:photosystem I reaction center subunit XII